MREAQSRVASAVCQSYDQVLPLAVGKWEEWRFAATSDGLTLRQGTKSVKLSEISFSKLREISRNLAANSTRTDVTAGGRVDTAVERRASHNIG